MDNRGNSEMNAQKNSNSNDLILDGSFEQERVKLSLEEPPS